MSVQSTSGKASGRPSVLGRGLDALFQDNIAENNPTAKSSELPIAVLKPNPFQPRRTFDDSSLAELAASIRKQGVIQPLLVRSVANSSEYQIVAGERRFRAARMAGLTRVPVLIREYDDREVMAAALIENLQREDLNPIEEARAIDSLRSAMNLTQEQVAERLGKSRSAVANSLRLLNLSQAAQDDLLAQRMTAGHARCLLGIEDQEQAEALRIRIVQYGLTVREAEQAVNFMRENGSFPWSEHPEQGSEDSPAEDKPKARRKKSPYMTRLQTDLSDILSVHATASGNSDSGRLTLVWTSQGEFEQLLEKLGLGQAAAENMEDQDTGQLESQEG